MLTSSSCEQRSTKLPTPPPQVGTTTARRKAKLAHLLAASRSCSAAVRAGFARGQQAALPQPLAPLPPPRLRQDPQQTRQWSMWQPWNARHATVWCKVDGNSGLLNGWRSLMRSITLPARSRLRRCSSSRGARIVLPFSSTNNSAGMHVCYVLTYVDIHPSGYVRSCVCMLVVPHLFSTESSAVSVLSREPKPRSCPKP